MTSELNMRPITRPAPPPGRSATRSTTGHQPASNQVPSVPITVYRELATELQMTHAQVDSLSLQNRRLTEQNQQLRQEISRIVQSALQLQHIVDSFQPGSFAIPDTFESAPPYAPASPPSGLPGERPGPTAPPVSFQEATGMAPPAPRFTEQPESPRPVRMRPPRSHDMSGLWLAVMIFVIIVTAFSAGFFIMRPFLTSDQ